MILTLMSLCILKNFPLYVESASAPILLTGIVQKYYSLWNLILKVLDHWPAKPSNILVKISSKNSQSLITAQSCTPLMRSWYRRDVLSTISSANAIYTLVNTPPSHQIITKPIQKRLELGLHINTHCTGHIPTKKKKHSSSHHKLYALNV